MHDTSHAHDSEAFLRAVDNVGADTSLWLRPLRLFFEFGKPPGEVAVLAFPHPQGTWPFGVVTKTKRNRIVFWPLLPTRPICTDPAGNALQIDHLTLELPSERIHVTESGSRGTRSHNNASDFGAAQAWRLQHYPGTGVSLFLITIVKLSTLMDQENIVQRRIAMPTTDGERRKRAIADYAAK